MNTKNKIYYFVMIALMVAISGCKDFKYDTYKVTDKPYANQTAVELFLGGDEGMDRIQLTSSPANGNFTWTSQNDNVASVSQNGLVTAKGEGYTNIFLKSKNDEFEVKVHVQQWIPMQNIILDVTSVQKYWYGVVDRFKINALYEPANTTEKGLIEWSSSNPAIATVTNEGWVTYTNSGKVTIYARAKGTESSVELTVLQQPVYQRSDPEWIDRSKWRIPGYIENSPDSRPGYSSQATNENPKPNGLVICLLTQSDDEFWHASWSNPSTGYPHWFIIDLGELTEFGGVMIRNRNNDSRGSTGFQLYATDVEVARDADLAEAAIWTSYGRFPYNPNGANDQNFAILPPYPVARYVKVYFGVEYKGSIDQAMVSQFGLYRPREITEPTPPPDPEPPFRKDWLYTIETLPGNAWDMNLGKEYSRYFKFIDEETLATCCMDWGSACDKPDWDLDDYEEYTYFIRLKGESSVKGVYNLEIYYKDLVFFNNKSTYNSNTNEFHIEFEIETDWDGDPGYKIVERAKNRR